MPGRDNNRFLPCSVGVKSCSILKVLIFMYFLLSEIILENADQLTCLLLSSFSMQLLSPDSLSMSITIPCWFEQVPKRLPYFQLYLPSLFISFRFFGSRSINLSFPSFEREEGGIDTWLHGAVPCYSSGSRYRMPGRLVYVVDLITDTNIVEDFSSFLYSLLIWLAPFYLLSFRCLGHRVGPSPIDSAVVRLSSSDC